MAISSVWSGPPVFSVISSVPGVSGLAGAAAVAADAAGAAAGGPTAVLIFSRAEYATGARGGPVPGYPASVELIGFVERKGQPTLLTEHNTGALRPLTQTVLEITTDVDPAVALGEPAGTSMTNWSVAWAGFEALVVGPAIPQGMGWITKAVLTL